MKTIYAANCVEHGERFVSYFQTSETNKESLKRIGLELAMGYGGECLSVKKFAPKVLVKITQKDSSKEPFIDTKTRVVNFLKKNIPVSQIVFPFETGKQRFELTQGETPKDVYDYDVEGGF